MQYARIGSALIGLLALSSQLVEGKKNKKAKDHDDFWYEVEGHDWMPPPPGKIFDSPCNDTAKTPHWNVHLDHGLTCFTETVDPKGIGYGVLDVDQSQAQCQWQGTLPNGIVVKNSALLLFADTKNNEQEYVAQMSCFQDANAKHNHGCDLYCCSATAQYAELDANALGTGEFKSCDLS